MNSARVTIVMPCLNEVETLQACIEKARLGLERAGIEGEILIADNGSTDGSIEIAERYGARVVHVTKKGYGNALRGGIEAAQSEWIIMGDADDSYDFSQIEGFIEKLRTGHDLVMGCRLPKGGGTVMPGAMPWKNRWIGNPILSFLGRLFFKSKTTDFHCGLRAFTKTAYNNLDLKTTGMEFASEMVMKATLSNMKIGEVPITLHPAGRNRPPHLRPWRDGWRHLRFMLIYSPRWLFLYPGLGAAILGLLGTLFIVLSPAHIGNVYLDVGTLMVTCMHLIVGVQLISLACFTKRFGMAEGLLREDPLFARFFNFFTLEKGIIAGLALLLGGVSLLGYALWIWHETSYGQLVYSENLGRLIPAATLIVLGIQFISASFFMSVLQLKQEN